MDKIFDPRYARLDPNNFNIDDIYTVTDKIIPRGRNSFKVLQELPIVLVLLYQLYKQNIHDHVVRFLPIILNTITLEPKKEYRLLENFNKEIFVDFMGAQIKTLAFLAYTIKTFPGGLMEIIETHARTLVEGMILLLRLCPKEVAHLRKELLVAIRHILATNLRNHFIPSIELLFDEDLLLGKGHTSLESLRPLAYSTLGDFIHHVRLELNFVILSKAIHLFSRNIHDETLPVAIQIMSIRLLLNLVECIRVYRHGHDLTTTSAHRKEMLQNMLKVFVLKFHTIATIQIPIITQKWKSFLSQQSNAISTPETPPKEFTSVEIIPEAISKLTSIGFTPPTTITISEYRLLVKSLVGGIKQIIFGINYIDSNSLQQQVLITLTTQEVQQFIDFFNWSLDAFYIYRVNAPASTAANQKTTAPPAVQREEKELLELFSGLFLNLSSQNFQEIFTTTISILIDKMVENQNLQIIINTFLSYRQTSPLFATVMVEFLLDRMDVIGSSDIEKSNLYLKLFKLIFGSVSMFATENETMIRPYLQKIVVNSMEMAMRAEEPYNYFLLLRALFRSIGGGTYDILYQEFLPLLPNLLGGLNRLQSGCHKQTMKDLFVELCLTVPVRLSSLLPFLPMLMDPLVSALNGSPMLVTQGLRTLELCVDNLLPDFFCDHIQPVRAELMQSLWKTLRNQDNAAMGAFRILGKFGGGNRNMLVEAQKIEYLEVEENTTQLQVSQCVNLPAKQIIDSAYEQLKNSTDIFTLKESWNIVKFVLISTIENSDGQQSLQNYLNQQGFLYNEIIENNQLLYEENVLLKTTLSALFLAASKKELSKEAHPFALFVTNQFTLSAISSQFTQSRVNVTCNPNYILDGVLSVMESEEKEVYAFGNSILLTIIQLASTIVGSRERACKLNIIENMLEKTLNIFYERSTFAKKGGCIALRFLSEQMPNHWISKHLFAIVKAHIFVIRDLADDVCSGTIDVAIKNIEFILEKTIPCLSIENPTEEIQKVYKSSVNEFVYHTASSHKIVREISMKSLQQIATIQKVSLTALLEPYKNFFAEIIVFTPAKTYLRHQPLATQIGILEANHFCTSLEPKLTKFDNYQFLTDVKIIIKCDDDTMCRYDAYKEVKLLPELRESAMKVLVAWHYIYHKQHYDTDKVKNINFCDEAFLTLFKSLEMHQNLQETAFECLKKLINECKEKTETGWPIQQSFLETLGDYSTWTANSIKRLSYYCLLFPKLFTEKTCEQLFEIVKKLLRGSITANQEQNYLKVAKVGEAELKIAGIINLFHIIPACSAKFVVLLIKLVLATEEEIGLESSCPFRESLVKFLLRYPDETIAFLLNDECMKNAQLNRFMIYLLNHKDGAAFKTIIESKGSRLKELILLEKPSSFRISNQQMVVAASGLKEDYEVRHQAVLIVQTIISFNDQWLPSQMGIVNALNQIWTNFLHKNALEENITCDFWHLITKILLHYFEHNPGK
jgi:transformation/transcription domain-associated protein